MRLVIVLACLFSLSAPALAVDLTGVWEGGFKCREYDGTKYKFAQTDETLLITQTGNALAIEWLGAADIQGVVVNDFKKPGTKGVASVIDCDTNTDLTSGYAEMGNLTATVDREKGKGKLKGVGVYTSDGDYIGECKWKFTLVSLEDPAASGCE